MINNNLSDHELQEQSKQSVLVRLQIVFYALTVLNSIGYVAYIIVFSQMLIKTVGGNGLLILLILAGSMLFETLLEIPTGAWADIKGHHKSVLWSFIVLGLHALFYLCASLFLFFGFLPWTFYGINGLVLFIIIAAEGFLALGTALNTGSLNSWFVVNAKKVAGEDIPLHEFMATKRFYTNVAWLFTGLFILFFSYAQFNEYLLLIAFSVAIISYGSAALISHKLIKAWPSSKVDPKKYSGPFSLMLDEFRGATSEIMRNRKLVTVIVTNAIFWTLVIIVSYFWQDLLSKDADARIHLDIGSTLIWILLCTPRILGSRIASKIKLNGEGNTGHRANYFIYGQLLIAVPLILICLFAQVFTKLFTGEWSFIIFGTVLLAMCRLGQELSKPISMAWTHEEIKSNRYRATIDSLIEASAGLVIFMTLPLLLYLNQIMGPQSNTLQKTLFFVIIFLCILVLFVNIPLTLLTFKFKNLPKKKLGEAND